MIATQILDNLKKLSLDEKTIQDISKNTKLTQALIELIESLSIVSLDKKHGNLIYSLVSKCLAFMHKDYFHFVGVYVSKQKISTNAQIEEAINFYKEFSKSDLKSVEMIKNFENQIFDKIFLKCYNF